MKKRALAKTVSVVFQFMVTAAAGFVITFGTFIYLLTGISLWVADYFGLPETDGVPAYILVLAFIVAVCLAACIVMAPYFMIPEDFSSVSGGEMLQGEIRSGDRAAQEGKNADRLHDVARLQADYKKLFKKKKLTKKALCDLVIPFRDKYGVKDGQALQVARSELSLEQMDKLLKVF